MLALVLLLAAGPPPSPAPARTTTVVAGPHYAGGAVHRLILGRGYRDLWTTPVTVELLDLQTSAGGLVPSRRVGGQQTRGLALQGADGHSYTFRSVDKDPSEILPADLHGTIADRVVQDQMAASHPGGAVVASAITRAAGVLTTRPRLVVMPDDPALGAFRADFAGLLGTLEEYPQPGFAGSTEILDHVEMWKRLQASPADQVDGRALVRARLVDVLVGDWDRHRKQWRWARLPGHAGWQPIAEDRDQAFARYEGLLLDVGRRVQPRFVEFGDDYPPIEGLTWNGWDVDRQLLTGVPRAAWDEIARDLQARLDDAVLAAAVDELPAAWRERDGGRLLQALRKRRDGLARIAGEYYEHLAGEVDVHGTDLPEDVDVDATDADAVRVTIREKGAAEPSWSRLFHPGETGVVRLHLHGGEDRVTVRGEPRMLVRALGGPGDDSYVGEMRASDHEGQDHPGPGTSLDRRPYQPPPGPARAPWIPARDWGRRTLPTLWASGGPDVGVFLGAGLVTHGYGFRRHPWADEQVLRAGWALGAETFRAEYHGAFRRENSGTVLRLDARASGIDILRFHGFGNGTTSDHEDAFYRVRQQQFELSPDVELPLGRSWTALLGPRLQHTSTRNDHDRIIGVVDPYGAGTFTQAGVEGGLVLDTRDRAVHPSRGVLAAVRSRLFPAAADVRSTFSSTSLSASAYLTPGHSPHAPTLALRAGATTVRGDYPFHEAAFLGGPDTVRGLRSQRYAGDSAAWAGAEVRVPVSARATLLVPGELGAHLFADTGRVWYEGDAARGWHSAIGGGLWFAVLGRQNTVSLTVARAEGHLGVYGGFGFSF